MVPLPPPPTSGSFLPPGIQFRLPKNRLSLEIYAAVVTEDLTAAKDAPNQVALGLSDEEHGGRVDELTARAAVIDIFLR